MQPTYHLQVNRDRIIDEFVDILQDQADLLARMTNLMRLVCTNEAAEDMTLEEFTSGRETGSEPDPVVIAEPGEVQDPPASPGKARRLRPMTDDEIIDSRAGLAIKGFVDDTRNVPGRVGNDRNKPEVSLANPDDMSLAGSKVLLAIDKGWLQGPKGTIPCEDEQFIRILRHMSDGELYPIGMLMKKSHYRTEENLRLALQKWQALLPRIGISLGRVGKDYYKLNRMA